MSELCAWLSSHGSNCAEAIGFVTGVLNVWLMTRENVWSWPVGIVNAAFYTVVFARAGLYSDTGLQVVYLGLSVYGWWHWVTAGGATGGTVASRGDATAAAPMEAVLPVTRTGARRAVQLFMVAVGLWLLLSAFTSRIPGAELPWFDAALVAGSLVAQWMMTRKLRECWIVWIAVDALYVGLFLLRGLQLTAVLYLVFLLLAIVGLVQWTRSAHRAADLSVASS